ncbi:MAG: alpha-glucan family phosphorylase [Saprospiraceae bacterium]|nr:alpha-glucan family phosphorylase [Saprospiraceae bacterium]
MPEVKKIEADFLFETSWEVCNKVGGIYTVISTKALSLVRKHKDNFILIGPDVTKGASNNADFIEDKNLLKTWRIHAEDNGLHFRVGRWNIAGKPIVILADFTSFFAEKDKIFAELWEEYKLDSLTGAWDYVEPAMFGYAAGKIIESYFDYYLNTYDRFVAQFHEWMTGTGILYLKKNVPQAATVFTTHATALGRSIAGNKLPLYGNLENYKGDVIAKQFNISSKYSLEKLSAIHADSFTTVSDITAQECKYLLEKTVDVVTPNGFEDSFVPDDNFFDEKRKIARKRLLDVSEALLNQKLDEDTQFIVNSGRYEFRNKGIDLFIDALGMINKQNNLEKEIVAFITIPAHFTSIYNGITQRIGKPDFDSPISNEYLTHHLFDKQNDPILNRIKMNELGNSPNEKVKIIFVPCYLNGEDGVINLNYYDLLIGFDISVFPSYYEPWGYTPLESVAFHIPTITTSLGGFGLWVRDSYGDNKTGVSVIERSDDNDNYVVKELSERLIEFCLLNKHDKNKARDKAFEISRIALWDNLVDNYYKAYSIALEKVNSREKFFKVKQFIAPVKVKKESPVWSKVLVKSEYPKSLLPLQIMSKNLWWSWNNSAIELFSSINPKLWKKFKGNPIAVLEALSSQQLDELQKNPDFVKSVNNVYNKFQKYLKEAENKPKDLIAYFSMEYGLHDSLKIFSGGLGVLAGDYLKEASDSNENLIGIGLLYRYGYFRQDISIMGDQLALYEPQRFSKMPLEPVKDENNEWITISLTLTGRKVIAKIWKVNIGRISLYLLDTDIEANEFKDRFITHQLYGGDWQNRFKQEMFLGLGGIRLIKKLGLKPKVFHCNEGHAALIGLERLRCLMIEERLSFEQAKEVVRASTLFTTHTPVPAGHDAFDEDIVRRYFPQFAKNLNISWEDFMGLGKVDENNPKEKFSMSILAVKLSQEVNGVSKLHGKVSQEIFNNLYDGYFPEESHISYVTNGVHFPTWISADWNAFYKKQFGKDFMQNQLDLSYWEKIHNVPNANIWKVKQKQRKILIDYIKERVEKDLTERQENPKLIFKTLQSFNDQTLTIGFARRFATYKRAHLLFSNLERLANLVSDSNQPIQFIFAGKAHPADKAGQDLIKRIIEISKMKEFLGKITFIENYDIELGKALTQGVDVWLNTPTRLMEASGTSGEKAIMNGVLNFSVLDGWWAEGFVEDAGWALKEGRTYANQDFQDQFDAEKLYDMFEHEIASLFYKRDSHGIPNDWVGFIKKNIAEISPRFTMKRQLDDYQKQFYTKLIKRNELMCDNRFQKARELTTWKRKVLQAWDSIEVVSKKIPDYVNHTLKLSENFEAEFEIDTKELNPNDIGVEVIFGQKENDQIKQILFKEELNFEEVDGNIGRFYCQIPATVTGVFDFAFRLYPKHELLVYRQDFPILKWI